MKKKFYSNRQMYTPFFLIASIILLGISTVSDINAQHTPWTQKADMPTGRKSYASCAIGDKIYVIGGRYENMPTEAEKTLSEYDPATDTWITKDSMPTARMAFSSSVVNGKIYAIGGMIEHWVPGSAAVEEYDPVTDNWVIKTPMPTPRLGLGTCVLDGKIYAIGGMTSGPAFWELMRDTVEVYDPVTDTWDTKTSMPTARMWFSTSVVNGKIYAIGGCPITKEPLATVEEYDPVTDTWNTKTSMPTARTNFAAAVVDGIIYVIGGGTVSGNPGSFSVVEAYDPATDTWTRKYDMPESRASISASAVGGEIYIVGGIPNLSSPATEAFKSVYEYNPAVDLTELVDTLYLDKCYAEAGNDTICVSTRMNDTSGIMLFANFESPDQTSVDSVQLFDDGLHKDGAANDSIYANVWPLNSDERQYYVDLHVTKEGDDTIIHHLNNKALFTTIGPVVYDDHIFLELDTVANPGDRIRFKLTLRNNGSIAAAPEVSSRIYSIDPNISVASQHYMQIGTIEAGNTTTSISNYIVEITEDCPVNSEVQLLMDITSNGFSFWTDTFTILVIESISGSENKENQLNQLQLSQNSPNPFSQFTTIQWNLPEPGVASLRVYDCVGKEVKTLANGFLTAGEHSFNFEAGNLPEGIYFYRLQTTKSVLTRKMILIR